jgi:hypothetical protein
VIAKGRDQVELDRIPESGNRLIVRRGWHTDSSNVANCIEWLAAEQLRHLIGQLRDRGLVGHI